LTGLKEEIAAELKLSRGKNWKVEDRGRIGWVAWGGRKCVRFGGYSIAKGGSWMAGMKVVLKS